MSLSRILVAVDDSPASLDAARASLDLAAHHQSRVRAISVALDGRVADALGGDVADTAERIAAGGRSVLGWVTDLAAELGVACDATERTGEPFRCILDEADSWGADLIVMGRSDRRGPSSPYLGSQTAHVLEFADTPVLVVPHTRRSP